MKKGKKMKISKKIYNMYTRLLGKEENIVEKKIVVRKEILKGAF